MSDTLITVVAVILSVVLVIVVPLVVTAQRVDDVSQSDVETLTSNFVDEMRITGKLTLDNYDKFLQNLTATGNTYDVSIEFKILDENPGKKSLQTTKDKIGENVYYSIYTTQVEEVLKNEKIYNLKQGDMVCVTVRNTNLTIGQELKNFVYKIAGNDTYTISASNSGLIIGNGSTDVILSDNVNENTIGYILRENDANGKILNENGNEKQKWTNQDIYVELYPTNITYNFNLSYFWRENNETEDYMTGDIHINDGNILKFTTDTQMKKQIQVYWKHSLLDHYSNIRTIDINIDKISPTIGDVVGTTTKGNTGTISVIDARDTGGSGLAASCYYYVWTDKNITTPPTAPTKDTDGWTINNTEIVDSDYNGKRCWVWVKDKAGNISEPKSAVVENIVPRITGVILKDAIVKKGENLKIEPQIVLEKGSVIDYKSISFESLDTSIATIVSETGVATGVDSGKTTIKCTITNYDGTKAEGKCTLTVIGVVFNPNGGKDIINTEKEAQKKTIKSNVTIAGADKAKYAWMTSNDLNNPPTNWTDFNSVAGGNVSKVISESGSYYLWIKVIDASGNEAVFVSNPFTVIFVSLKLVPSTTVWTNKDVIVTAVLNKTVEGYKLQTSIDGKTWTNDERCTITKNGTVYARLFNEANYDKAISISYTVTNIDKIQPTIKKALSSNTTINSFELNLEVKDENNIGIPDKSSGLSKIIWYYKLSTSSTYTSVTDIDTEMNGEKAGTTETVTKKKTITELIYGTYNAYAVVYDVAGNSTQTGPIDITLQKSTFTVNASGYDGNYDGNAHGITVTCSVDGVTINYGTTSGNYTTTTNPTYTNPGTYTVYYEVSKYGYETVTGSQTVKIKGDYTISYNSNGGSGSMDNTIGTATKSVTLRANGFSAPSGKVFVCWSTNPEGTGTIYKNKASYTQNSVSNVTLYAIWAYELRKPKPVTYSNHSGGLEIRIGTERDLKNAVPGYRYKGMEKVEILYKSDYPGDKDSIGWRENYYVTYYNSGQELKRLYYKNGFFYYCIPNSWFLDKNEKWIFSDDNGYLVHDDWVWKSDYRTACYCGSDYYCLTNTWGVAPDFNTRQYKMYYFGEDGYIENERAIDNY